MQNIQQRLVRTERTAFAAVAEQLLLRPEQCVLQLTKDCNAGYTSGMGQLLCKQTFDLNKASA